MKYKNKYFNLLASNDITGDPISFTINKQDSPKTLIGGIISTALFLFMTCLFFLELKEMFGRQNPNISSFLKLNPNPEKMKLVSDNLPFAFSVMGGEGNSLNELLEINAVILQGELKDHGGYEFRSLGPVPITKCTKNNFPNVTHTIYQNSHFSEFLCFENQNFTLEGLDTASVFTVLELEISYCGDGYNSLSSDCTKKTLIQEKLKSGEVYFMLYYHNNIYDPSDYAYPIKKYLQDVFFYLDLEKTKYSEIYLKREILKTDDGLILQSDDTRSIISVDSSSNYDSPKKINKLAIIDIIVSSKEYIGSRSYNKVSSIMADVMGLYEYLKFAVKLIFTISNLKGNIRLINSIFDIYENYNDKIIRKINKKAINTKILEFNSDKKQENKVINLDRKHINVQENLNLNRISYDAKNKDSAIYSNYSHSMNDISRDDVVIDNKIRTKKFEENQGNIFNFCESSVPKGVYIKTIIKTKNTHLNNKRAKESKKNKKFGFSHYEMIKMNFFRCCLKNKKLKKKYELFEIAKEKLENKLEIFYIMNKLQEVEKLKVVLFNNQQLAVFNNLSKEICSFSEENNSQFKFNNLIEFQKNQDQLNFETKKFIYKKRFNDEYFDSVDQRLFDFLPIELKNHNN